MGEEATSTPHPVKDMAADYVMQETMLSSQEAENEAYEKVRCERSFETKLFM